MVKIQTKIVLWLTGSLCTGEDEVTPINISDTLRPLAKPLASDVQMW